MPELDRSDSLTGPDRDNNGIRDDIDRYLLTVEASEAEKLALIQSARAFQSVQAANLNDDRELREISDKLVRGTGCVMLTYESSVAGSQANRKLQGYTANTRNRARHYIKYNDLMDGSVTKLPDDVCDNIAQ